MNHQRRLNFDKVLQLSFSQTNVTDAGLRALAAGLECMRGLQELTIDFG
jgi:hypothetical protein